MKKVTLIIGSILFSTLFYEQSLGLNITFFCLITLAVLITYNLKAFKRKSTVAYSLLYVISAISFFFFNSNLALIANILSFLTLVGHVSELNTSIYVNWLNGFYTFVAGFFHRNFAIDKTEDRVKPKKDIDYVQWIKIIGIPLAVITIFISLYRKGNPVFNDLINKIDFGFINFQWILLSFFGYYLLYNISKPVKVDPATSLDKNTNNNLTQKHELLLTTLKKENQLGVVLIALLNLLILFFLITDFTFLLSTKDLRASVYSNQVHSGINALIASIVMAIAIILYFFRGNLNFYKENTHLKMLAYIWIVLNLILVINTAIKDCQYIYYFGFTYKRIGVLMYLLLTVIGLTTTAIKVKNIKNLWYLLRVNTITAFAILVISCTINWDAHITHYNLNFAKSIDFNYLINLSNNNVFVLKEHCENINLDEEKVRKIENKYNKYIQQLKRNNWQEFNYDNFKLQ
ncbi:DUF4153 domain-containing protein [Seonamhaeicola marinus]|uniref:DUF4173 domain-containing protein n=1 Tax=Seonamhaeicola marinus TaxID=1912246 RepID=A0A5D0ISF9_9FLAO|nr:DUF4173 domain-containing protein [Seonamhaeicola marinus]TYA86803.1 DUF4173 domain-containing protein [Seonamhaeicola marinus]